MPSNKVDQLTTSQRLANMSRSPFMDKLAQALDHGPSDEAITAIANRNPDRYAQYVAIFARLAGYSDKLEVESTVSINSMSDAELETELARLVAEHIAHSPNVCE